ncbi:MAG: hypothetical protein KGJ60_07345 [Verrucomicrobiota bacterium]|nr:hypothetical protein [Verrucomicrobiota bacterium]
MNTIATLSAQQLQRAAEIKEEIESLQHELNRIFGPSNSETTSATSKPKRRMSASGRRRIAAAQRARWAKVKAAKKA